MKRPVFLIVFLAAITIQAAPEPQIGAVLRHEGAHEISVIYSDRVNVSTLANPGNYSISPVSIASLRLVATNQGAILRVTGLSAGSSGALSIINITDPSGNALPPATLQFSVPNRLWAEIGANELGFRPEVVGIPEN